jgi:hypothetical protein
MWVMGVLSLAGDDMLLAHAHVPSCRKTLQHASGLKVSWILNHQHHHPGFTLDGLGMVVHDLHQKRAIIAVVIWIGALRAMGIREGRRAKNLVALQELRRQMKNTHPWKFKLHVAVLRVILRTACRMRKAGGIHPGVVRLYKNEERTA